MNEKEAREIQNNPEITSDNPMLAGKAYEAKGYLERVEQEKEIFGPLVKAFRPDYDKKNSACGGCTPFGCTVVKNFLCTYHKAVKFLNGDQQWT